jgi:hypothetical protein
MVKLDVVAVFAARAGQSTGSPKLRAGLEQ